MLAYIHIVHTPMFFPCTAIFSINFVFSLSNMYACMYVCMHAYMCVCVYIYIQASLLSPFKSFQSF